LPRPFAPPPPPALIHRCQRFCRSLKRVWNGLSGILRSCSVAAVLMAGMWLQQWLFICNLSNVNNKITRWQGRERWGMWQNSDLISCHKLLDRQRSVLPLSHERATAQYSRTCFPDPLQRTAEALATVYQSWGGGAFRNWPTAVVSIQYTHSLCQSWNYSNIGSICSLKGNLGFSYIFGQINNPSEIFAVRRPFHTDNV
jgi:hypothetical protein